MSNDDRLSDDPNRIDGEKWFEAVKPCHCGTMPDVWRTYIELQDRKVYAVRCPTCNHEIQAKSRNRCIRKWNETLTPETVH